MWPDRDKISGAERAAWPLRKVSLRDFFNDELIVRSGRHMLLTARAESLVVVEVEPRPPIGRGTEIAAVLGARGH